MPSTASIMVSLKAQTRNFQAGMKRASSSITQLRESALRVSATALKMGGALAGAATGGMLLLTRQSYRTLDAQAKLADRLGATTQEIAGLRHAAELAGPGADALDKGLEQLARRAGELKFKSGEASVAIERLGLDANTLASASPASAFIQVAQALTHVESQSEKVALAYQVLGRSGIGLVNVLALGQDGLAEAAAEAERFGLALSRVDHARIEEANDAWTRTKAALRGVANVVAVETSPFVEALADKLTAVIPASDSLRKHLGGAFESLAEGAGIVSREVLRLRAHVLELAASASMTTSRVRNAVEGFGMRLGASYYIGRRARKLPIPPPTIGPATQGMLEGAAEARLMMNTIQDEIRTAFNRMRQAPELNAPGATPEPLAIPQPPSIPKPEALSFGAESVGALRAGSVEAAAAERRNTQNMNRVVRILEENRNLDADRNGYLSDMSDAMDDLRFAWSSLEAV